MFNGHLELLRTGCKRETRSKRLVSLRTVHHYVTLKHPTGGTKKKHTVWVGLYDERNLGKLSIRLFSLTEHNRLKQ